MVELGLGLALVKEWVETMGGTVGVESAQGAGSCFSMRLPGAIKNVLVMKPTLSEALKNEHVVHSLSASLSLDYQSHYPI